ncbi:ExbD/TolR family protein [Glaciecola siphonariae]|uniref:ExbD/TolR family protein n=1 Tax=Glaciecola siphonariae TaxID=521012 RepID=A0ABV9LSF2_9ALTE
MLANRRARVPKAEAELDITSFMNLMIVLVPVLLMMMVFSRITVVELQLPGLAALSDEQSIEEQVLEVHVYEQGLEVFFPQGYLLAQLPKITSPEAAQSSDAGINSNAAVHDTEGLQQLLKQIKQTLLGQGVEKRNISLLMQPDTDYQTIVTLIDATRSYKDVVAASVVDAELFPDVSLADAPSDTRDAWTPPEGGAL